MFFLNANQLKAQHRFDKVSLGIGVGLDYGGIGGSLLYYPHQNFGLFAGVGYSLTSAGVIAGTKLRLISEKYVLSPYLIWYVWYQYSNCNI